MASTRRSKSPASSSPEKKTKARCYDQKFRETWLVDDRYSPWLLRDPVDPKRGQCSVCCKSFVAKRSNLNDHAKGAKHVKRLKEKFDPSPPPPEPHEATQADKDKMRAEIKLAAWGAAHDIPFRTFDHLPDLLAKTFPGSKIAQNLQLKRTKVSSVVMNVIGQGFIEDTERQINASDDMGRVKYSIIIDETTDRSEKQVAVIVKYFDGPVMKTRLLDVIAVADGDAESLFSALSSVIVKKGLHWKDCVGWCADTSDVMHGDQDSVKNRLTSLNPSVATVNRSCTNAALVASLACEVLPQSLEKLVHDVYGYFAHSNKRTDTSDEFQELADTNPHKLLRPCQTRWLSLGECVTRLLAQWDALLPFMQDQDLREKNAQAHEIVTVMSNPYVKIHLEFLSFVLPKILVFSEIFQSSGSMIHSLADTMSKLYSDILSLYVEPSFIQEARSLADIDPSDEAVMLPLESTYIGVAASQSLATLNSPDGMKVEFLQLCRAFLAAACEEIRNQFPLSDPMLVAASKLNVHSAKSGQVPSFVGDVLPHFPGVAADDKLQLVDDLWRELPYREDLSADSDFLTFWWKVFSDDKCGPLSYCVKSILLMPVANADCERVFTDLRQTRSAQRNRFTTDSLVKLVVAREGVQETGCAEFEPSEAMYHKFKSTTLYLRQAHGQENGACQDEQSYTC